MLKVFLCLALLCTACGTQATHQTQAESKEPISGPFSIVYDTFGGVPIAFEPGLTPCGNISRLVVNESTSEVISFCAPLEANRIIYRHVLASNDNLLAPVLDALSSTKLEGTIEVGRDSTVADDWSFQVTAQTSKKSLLASGYAHSVAISSELHQLLDVLDQCYVTVTAATP